MVPGDDSVPPVASELSAEHGNPVNGFVAVDGVGNKPLGSAGDTAISGPVGSVSGALGLTLCADDVTEFNAARPAIRQRNLRHLPIMRPRLPRYLESKITSAGNTASPDPHDAASPTPNERRKFHFFTPTPKPLFVLVMKE